MKTNVNKLVRMAMLIALSVVLLYLINFPIIPAAPYLKYEPADVPILIGTFMYGPLAGLLMTLIAAFIQTITLDAASGWVGFVMHVIATGTLVLVAGTVYKAMRTLKGAIIGLISGCIAMTLIMIPSNFFFSVKFFGIPYEAVKAMVIPVLIPFNLIKSVSNSILTLLIYKSIGKILNRIDKNKHDDKH